MPFDRVAWETMTQIQENCLSSFFCRWARTTPLCFNGRGMDAYSNSDIFHMQGLLYAKSLLRKLTGGSEFSSDWERNRDADDTSSDVSSSSVVRQSTSELSEILSQADVWLGHQSLLGSGILLLLMISLTESHLPIFVTR
ncbi:hypothetical protein TSUD_313420 [Trifolium subterraneum]|uniref:Uncharacterized protein n=1 Tax=Trifolium subterraneum TaxID=3900 RepID=A0A2Z6MDW7_TRISU|nr:hypothetical protein TSUD_313420 [Trifolium subterraneum]